MGANDSQNELQEPGCQCEWAAASQPACPWLSQVKQFVVARHTNDAHRSDPYDTRHPTSPFVNALWTHLDDQQKESTIDLNEHLVKANWILLRSRALCLFAARALSSTAKRQRKLKLMAEVVARKEQEIERMMINESSEETASDDCPSPVHRGRRAAPRIPRMVLNESSDEPSDESPSVSLSPLPSPSPRHRRGRRNGPRRPSDPQLSLHKRRKRTAGSA